MRAVGAALSSEEGTPREVALDCSDDEFVGEAVRQKVCSLLAAQGPRIGLSDVVVAALNRRVQSRTVHSLRLASESCRLDLMMRETGIPGLFFKGTTLSVLSTGTLNARETSDIDVLVRPEDMPAMHEALLEQGWVTPYRLVPGPGLAWQHACWAMREFPYSRNGIAVDLHWRLSVQEDLLASPSQLLDRAFEVPVGSSMLPTLGPADALLLLCFSCYNDKFNQLRFLVDIRRLLRMQPGLPPDTSRQARRMAADVLTFAEALIPGWPRNQLENLGLSKEPTDSAYPFKRWDRYSGVAVNQLPASRPSDYTSHLAHMCRYAPHRVATALQMLSVVGIALETIPPGSTTKGYVRAIREKARRTKRFTSKA